MARDTAVAGGVTPMEPPLMQVNMSMAGHKEASGHVRGARKECGDGHRVRAIHPCYHWEDCSGGGATAGGVSIAWCWRGVILGLGSGGQ
jgi:hypothetical protein